MAAFVSPWPKFQNFIKMVKETFRKSKHDLILDCDCGCKSQIQIVKYNGDIMVDCRNDKRSKWIGVYLDEHEVDKIRKLIS